MTDEKYLPTFEQAMDSLCDAAAHRVHTGIYTEVAECRYQLYDVVKRMIEAEVARLTAENEQLIAQLDGRKAILDLRISELIQAKAELAEARKDVARLDWLEANGVAMGSAIEMNFGVHLDGSSIREAIDRTTTEPAP